MKFSEMKATDKLIIATLLVENGVKQDNPHLIHKSFVLCEFMQTCPKYFDTKNYRRYLIYLLNEAIEHCNEMPYQQVKKAAYLEVLFLLEQEV